jgi:uncharacterized protein with PIN domain
MYIRYCFQGTLSQLLRSRWRGTNPIIQPFTRPASIKDVLEAFGPPHTEIGSILCNGQPVDFYWPISSGQNYEIAPIIAPWDISQATLLRPQPLLVLRFLADRTVGRLARYLRMAGLDTLYEPDWNDDDIVAALQNEPRVLLTRNLDLLKRKQVVFGRAIRMVAPFAQLREVLDLFGINQLNQGLSRCLQCNQLLEPVDKSTILHRLEPLTIRYYHTFNICRNCDQIFWAGSHVGRMRELLEQHK